MLQVNKDVNLFEATANDVEVTTSPIGWTRDELLKSIEKEALIKHLVNIYEERLIIDIYGQEHIDTYNRLRNYISKNHPKGWLYEDNHFVEQYPKFFRSHGISRYREKDRYALKGIDIDLDSLQSFLLNTLKKELL